MTSSSTAPNRPRRRSPAPAAFAAAATTTAARLSDARRCKDRMVLSLCNLFTASQFIVPTSLLAMHGCKLLSIASAVVFTSSMVFHRHCLKTSWVCNPSMRVMDISTTVCACMLVVFYGHTDTITMCIAAGVPIFYLCEVRAMVRCASPHTRSLPFPAQCSGGPYRNTMTRLSCLEPRGFIPSVMCLRSDH